MSKSRYPHSFALNEQEETDFITAQAVLTQAQIIRMGIKEALKLCKKPSKELIEKVKKAI